MNNAVPNFTNIRTNIGNAAGQVGNLANNLGNNTNAAITNFKTNVQTTLNQYGNPRAVATSDPEFLSSNSLTAKIAFTILVLIVFAVLVVVGVNLIAYFTQTPTNPILVDGMIDGNNSIMLPGSLIGRSNNRKHGIEFSWSLWLQVNDIGNKSQQYHHVFNKGNGTYNLTATKVNGVSYPLGTGIASVTNAPGLYLTPTSDAQMSLHIVMDSVDPNATAMTMDVAGIPMNKKWVHVVLRLENTSLDVYINGTIAGRHILASVPRQNYGDIYVCQNGGFAGKLSNLRYFPHALSAFEINQIVTQGPNTTASSLAGSSSKGSPYYLSSAWYFSKI
jgi:hypothetical protein